METPVTFAPGWATPIAPPTSTFRMPPGGRGYANAGVVAILMPNATPAHLADMAEMLVKGPPQ